MSAAPCPSCPWRKHSHLDDIPGFSIEKARNLRCTVGNEDGFRTVMACHGSSETNNIPCAGYLFVEGWRNLNVRMLAFTGKIDMGAVLDACDGLELHESFDEMLAMLEDQHAGRD